MSNTVHGRGRPPISAETLAKMRKKISEEAERLFNEEGYGTISMRRIAKEIGCSPMSLYKYYDAKIDILRSLWAGVFDDLFGNLDHDVHSVVKGADRLISLSKHYVRFWIDHPEKYRLVFMAEGVSQPDVSVFLDDPAIVSRFDIFMNAVRDCHEETLEATRLKLILDCLLCYLHGIAHNTVTISGYPWTDIDVMVEAAVPKLAELRTECLPVGGK